MQDLDRFSDLSSEDEDRLAAMLEWVAGHYPEEGRQEFDSIGGKLILIQTILDNDWIDPRDEQCTLKRQCLGAALGAALVQYYPGLAWKAVDDEFGRDPCLVLGDSSVQINPITMISKRLEGGEVVDVKSLVIQTCELLDRVRQEAV